jgi:hypothetical protein
MNERSDFDRTLRHWFDDGPSVMPDRVVDGVAARIARQPQRRAWRLQGRPYVNTYAKLAAAAAAVLVVGVVGWQLLPGRGNVGGDPTTAPSASPTVPAPTATPAATAAPLPGGGELSPGTYVARPVVADPLGWQLTVPEGWASGGNWFIFPPSVGGPAGNNADEPNGLAVAFLNEPEIFLDPCDFASMSNTGTVEELVAAIRAQAGWVVSAPIASTISGFSARRLDVTLPADLSVCGPDQYLVFGEPGTENGFFAQGPAQQLRIWILGVQGRIVGLVRESFAGTPAKELTEAQSIIESSVITP